MKSFKADSNSKYIQSIDLPAGQYTFSAIVQSPNMLYSFAIEEIGGWRTFDLNLHTTEFKKVSIQFLTAKVTKIDLVSNNASPSNVIEIVSPMLNGGTIASPAKRHELDLTESITSQEIFTQYSVDGSSNWHDTYVAGDRYMRTKKGEGNWSAPMLFVGEDGAAGADGKYTEIEFAKNTSTTTAPTSGWQDAPPTASEGEYVWMRQGEVIPPATTPSAWSPAVRLTGVEGTNGISVTSVVIQYAKNTSATVAPTSGWGTTRPVWESGTYLWQRTFTTYSDSTTSVGTPSLDNTWQAEGKIIDLENKTDFLTGTTVEGNAVATGTLLVGNSDGTNAGLTGLGNSSDGVYLWGGGTYQQMMQGLAKKEQRRNGIDIWRHPNGQIGFEIGIKDGRLIFNGYHSDGYKLFELDPNRGLIAVSYTQESWTQTPLRKLNYTSSTFDESTITNEIKLAIIKQSKMEYYTPPPYSPDSEFGYITTYNLSQNAVGYDYDNGTNPANSSYESLKGMKANYGDRYTNMSNGWYVSSIGEIHMESEWNSYPPMTYTFTVYVYYYQDGKITQTKVVTITK